jgi:hypothetical protein
LHIHCMIGPSYTGSSPISGGHTVRMLLGGFRPVAFSLISKPPPSAYRPPLRRAELQFTTVGRMLITPQWQRI